MKKFTLPRIKLNLSKKQMILISLSFLVIIFAVSGYFLWESLNNNTKDQQNENLVQYADDSENAQNNLLQKYIPSDTETKFKVYAEGVSVVSPKGETLDNGISIMKMTESCTYSDGTTPKEITYTVGLKPTEVSNHCLLTFKEATAFMASDDYLNVYIVLPDNSLIVLSTKDSPSIQVNIYNNETRVIQVNGYAYYRIAKQGENHKFVTQISDVLLQATGTEYYAQAAEDKKNTLWGSFQLLEGSAKLVDRAGKFIYDMLIPEDYDYGVVNGFRWTDAGMWENDRFSYNKGKIYTFTSVNNVSEETDPKAAIVNAPDAPTNFLSDQVMLTLKKYGFGNFITNIGGHIEAMVSEQIESVQDLRRDTLASEYASQSQFWDEYNSAVEEEEKDSSSSNSGSTSNSSDDALCSTSGAAYQLCRMALELNNGSAHMEGSKCCIDSSVEEPTLEAVP